MIRRAALWKDDEIVEEVRRAREQLFAECNNDPKLRVEYLKKRRRNTPSV